LPALKLRAESELPAIARCPIGVLVTWHQQRFGGALGHWASVRMHSINRTRRQALESAISRDLAQLSADSGLRAVQFEVTAWRYQRATRQQLLRWLVEPEQDYTMGRLWGSIEQALAPDGVMPSGTRVEVSLQGLPPHPPEPWPARQPLGGRR
jgi:hypothetical protein